MNVANGGGGGCVGGGEWTLSKKATEKERARERKNRRQRTELCLARQLEKASS